MAHVRQPLWLKPAEVPPLPAGWRALPTEEVSVQLKPGERYDKRTVRSAGAVPVLNQSETGFIGYHDNEPGVLASVSRPVVTFANHTCALRLVKEPFSCIQNIFPVVGKQDVADTTYFYYAALGRVDLTDYKGHHPIFRRALIPVPPLSVQRRIAAILSAYDDLIENNLRRIRILEEMAGALYREWFVHFRFPGHESMTAKDSASLPPGWEASRLDEALLFTSGRTIKKAERETGDTPVYGANGIIGHTANEPIAQRCIIMGKIGSCGALHRSPVPCWVTNNAFLVQPSRIQSDELAWQMLCGTDFTKFIGGAANPYMPLNLFGHLEIPVPPASLQSSFEHRAASWRRLVETLSLQNDNLRRTRDLLLPRLLSGQVALAERAAT